MKKLKKAKQTYKAKKIQVNIELKKKKILSSADPINYRLYEIRSSALKKEFNRLFSDVKYNKQKIANLAKKQLVQFKTPKWYAKDTDNFKRVSERNKWNFAKGVTPATLYKIREEMELVQRFRNKNPLIIEQYLKTFNRYIDLGIKAGTLKEMLKDADKGKANAIQQELAKITDSMEQIEKNPEQIGFVKSYINQKTGERFFDLPNAIYQADKQDQTKLAEKLEEIASKKPYDVDPEEEEYINDLYYAEGDVRGLIESRGGLETFAQSNPEGLEEIASRSGFNNVNEFIDAYNGMGGWKTTQDKANVDALKNFRKGLYKHV